MYQVSRDLFIPGHATTIRLAGPVMPGVNAEELDSRDLQTDGRKEKEKQEIHPSIVSLGSRISFHLSINGGRQTIIYLMNSRRQ